jgi:hypothetical protein
MEETENAVKRATRLFWIERRVAGALDEGRTLKKQNANLRATDRAPNSIRKNRRQQKKQIRSPSVVHACASPTEPKARSGFWLILQINKKHHLTMTLPLFDKGCYGQYGTKIHPL